MEYETKEAINNLALCSAILFFVPFALGLGVLFTTNPVLTDNTQLAIVCIVIEIISLIVAGVTDVL